MKKDISLLGMMYQRTQTPLMHQKGLGMETDISASHPVFAQSVPPPQQHVHP